MSGKLTAKKHQEQEEQIRYIVTEFERLENGYDNFLLEKAMRRYLNAKKTRRKYLKEKAKLENELKRIESKIK